MIKIDNLTKTYQSKNKTVCKALNGISITLPETGLVFILGKSGSGKSTLLNMIGGLDVFDSGDIIVFGNSLNEFSEGDYEAYRSSFISFVFQDFHLIEELTAIENVTAFCEQDPDEDFLQNAIETTDIGDFLNKYPSELSGGQKQRVAIARGIIKNPKVILCDEPTGNLDRKTSVKILDLLKELSKQKLVIIVSHNYNEANTYADRIIELADGRVINDQTREQGYVDALAVNGDTATLPYHNRMNDDELKELNANIQNGNVKKIDINTSGFSKTNAKYNETPTPLTLKKISDKNMLRLFKNFFSAKKRSSIGVGVLLMIMVGAFAVIQSFVAFDANAAIGKSISAGEDLFAIERNFEQKPLKICDLSNFSSNEYYKLYNLPIWLSEEKKNSLDHNRKPTDKENFEDIFISESYGLLECTSNYLIDLYGVNGEIKLAAGSFAGVRDGSAVLITDYFADCILYYDVVEGKKQDSSYNDIIGIFYPANMNSAANIAGIIDTGYRQRYSSMYDLAELYASNKISTDKLKSILSESTEYIEFMDEVIMHLGVSYTFNKNYMDSFSLTDRSLVSLPNLFFCANDIELCGNNLSYMSTTTSGVTYADFADDEIAIPYTIYNDIFGTNYTKSDANKLNRIEPKNITIKNYADDDNTKEVLYQKEFTVTALTTTRIVGSKNTMLYFQREEWRPIRLYFKNAQDVGDIIDYVNENNFHLVSIEHKNMQRLSDIKDVFHDLFVFIQIVIILLITFYMIGFGVKSIRQNTYQIGVIKALGGRNVDVMKIFVLKTFIIGFAVSVISALTSTLFIVAANSILVASIETVLGMKLLTVSIISIIPALLVLDAAAMIIISFISALLPTIMLKKIKPFKIIKAKE